jgi:hypothetical protein
MIYSRTHHLLISAYGSRWEQVQLAMVTVYVDDSGTAPSQHVAIATGLVIPGLDILRLEKEWERLKAKEGFSDFHTSEFIARNYKSEFGKWDDVTQRRVFDRVRQIAKKYGVVCGSIAVNKQDYEEVLPEDFRKLIGGHFTWAFHHLLSLLRKRREVNHAACPGFEYVIDWMETGSPERAEVENAMGRAEEVAIEDGNPGEFENFSFRRRKDIPGLQCVDCVSWVAYRYALFAFHKTPLPSFAEIGWEDFGGPLETNGWLGAATIRRHHLQNWYAQVVAKPENLDRYRRTEAKRLAKRQGRSVINSPHANAKSKTA